MQALRADLKRAREHGDALSPGVQALVVYRFGRWALRRPPALRLFLDPLYALLDLMVRALWGIEISRRAQIGPGLYIAHAGGLVVARGAVIGANCNLSHDVTIGLSGHGEKCGVPVIGDDVYIDPGAKLFGKIRVGDNVKIGANTVVYRDVPANAVVALSPGFQIVSFEGNRRGAPLQRASSAASSRGASWRHSSVSSTRRRPYSPMRRRRSGSSSSSQILPARSAGSLRFA